MSRLALSSGTLRQNHILACTLTIIGDMAHEPGTLLSTAALVGDATQLDAQREPVPPSTTKRDEPGQRLHPLCGDFFQQVIQRRGGSVQLQSEDASRTTFTMPMPSAEQC